MLDVRQCFEGDLEGAGSVGAAPALVQLADDMILCGLPDVLEAPEAAPAFEVEAQQKAVSGQEHRLQGSCRT